MENKKTIYEITESKWVNGSGRQYTTTIDWINEEDFIDVKSYIEDNYENWMNKNEELFNGVDYIIEANKYYIDEFENRELDDEFEECAYVKEVLGNNGYLRTNKYDCIYEFEGCDTQFKVYDKGFGNTLPELWEDIKDCIDPLGEELVEWVYKKANIDFYEVRDSEDYIEQDDKIMDEYFYNANLTDDDWFDLIFSCGGCYYKTIWKYGKEIGD